MIRDLKLTKDCISTEELRKIYSQNISRKRLRNMDYELFLEVLYQIALHLFSRAPNDLRNYPSAASVSALFQMFSMSGVFPKSKARNGDRDTINSLNEKLLENPGYPMPQGYTIATERLLTVDYRIPKLLRIPRSCRISLEILDEVVWGVLNFHILQPVVGIGIVTRAKGALNKSLIPNLSDKIRFPLDSVLHKALLLPHYTNFTQAVKLEIAKLSACHSDGVLVACGSLLDDLIYSVENSSLTIMSRNHKPTANISKKFIHSKIIEENLLKDQREQTELKRLRRHKQLGIEVKRNRKLKAEKEQLQNDIKLREIKRVKDAQKKRQEIDNQMKLQNELQIKELNEKKYQEELQRQIEEESETNQTKEKREKKQKSVHSGNQLIERLHTMEKAIRHDDMREIKAACEIANKEEAVISLKETYHLSLTVIFESFNRVNSPNCDPNLMLISSLTQFTTQFNLSPCVIPNDLIAELFTALVGDSANSVNGLDLDGFIALLMRVALLSRSKLEEDLKRELTSYGDQFAGLLEWMYLPVDPEKMYIFLKLLRTRSRPMNQRERVNQKNLVLKKIYRQVNSNQ